MEIDLQQFYSRDRLMTVPQVTLRAMIVERTHHTVEIQLYEAISKGKRLRANTGEKVRELLAIWQERGLPLDWGAPDFAWVKGLLDMAKRASGGEPVDLSRFACRPLDGSDQGVARRMIAERRSVRHWTDEEIPDWMIDEILKAGLWGAHGCNLCSLRFLVVREKNAPGLFRGGDVPGGPMHIVACQDMRNYSAQPAYLAYPDILEKNRVLDCGAAMQNMVLMAHALGLGGLWLTFSPDMVDRLRKQFQLEEDILIVTYMDVGFPSQTPMPPGRMPVKDTVLVRI